MALGTLGTAATTSLVCLQAWSPALLSADVGAIDQAITPDNAFAAVTDYLPGPAAIYGTGNTHTTTTLDTLAAGSGSPPLSQIKAGMNVSGPGIPPGTYVAAVLSGTSVQLSQAATSTVTGANVFFKLPGLGGAAGGYVDRLGNLVIPNRGRLRMFPGDILAIDLITGWPILVSAAAISATGSVWSKA